jgi:hypothetical protein
MVFVFTIVEGMPDVLNVLMKEDFPTYFKSMQNR